MTDLTPAELLSFARDHLDDGHVKKSLRLVIEALEGMDCLGHPHYVLTEKE